jgi:hypothetical protein
LLGWVECSLKAGLLHEAEALGTSLPVNLKEGGQHIISVTSPLAWHLLFPRKQAGCSPTLFRSLHGLFFP